MEKIHIEGDPKLKNNPGKQFSMFILSNNPLFRYDLNIFCIVIGKTSCHGRIVI